MGKLWIVGLGPGDAGVIPPANLAVLRRIRPLFLRTACHPLVSWLKDQGISFTSFDRLYEEQPTFTAVYDAIVTAVLAETEKQAEVGYAVPGHPLVAEETVRQLLDRCRERQVAVTVLPAMSCLDAVFAALAVDPAEGLVITEAARLQENDLRPELGLIVLQVYNRLVASSVKLTLAPVYGDTWPVYLVRAAGVAGEEKVVTVPLYAVDRQPWIDHLTTLYVPPARHAEGLGPPGSFHTLVAVLARLRGPHGCPWDRAQTHASLRRYLLEEAYEVLEALDEGDMPRLAEELGDLLLQIVFHAQMASEAGYFTIADVIAGINEKMRRRHPHVFAGARAESPAEVTDNWRRIKEQEKGKNSSLLAGIPDALPALARAQKIQERAAAVHFDWPEIGGVWQKLHEEEEELRQAVAAGRHEEVERELGDLLFAVVNLARFLGVGAEEALRRSTASFCRRFSYMEQQCRRQGRALEELRPEELDALWEEAKVLGDKNFRG